MVSQANNTNSTTFQNAALSNAVYGPSVSTAPSGYVTLKTYGDPSQTNALVVLYGKVDPTTGEVTSFETAVRGTHISDLDSGTIQDLNSDAEILLGNSNNSFVDGIQTAASQIVGDLNTGTFAGTVQAADGTQVTISAGATLQGNTGQSLGGFGADLLQAVLRAVQRSQLTLHLDRASGPERAAAYLSCLLYTSPSPRDRQKSRMPSSA